jgi:hypothetical protein
MTYLPVANPTTDEPSHQATISDGTTTVGLKLYNSRTGKVDHRAISRVSLNRSALKTYSGSQKYGDLEQPYIAIAQDDWSGGRGQISLEDNTSKYNDSYMMDTTGGNLRLAGMPIFTSGYRIMNSHDMLENTNVEYFNLYGTTLRVAEKFTSAGTYPDLIVDLYLKYVGSPDELTIAIHNDSTGAVGTERAHIHVSATGYGTSTISLSRVIESISTTLVTATPYWLVVYGTGTPTAANHWMIPCEYDPGGYWTTKVSANGSTWADNGNSSFYRVYPSRSPFKAHPFTYRGQLYFATQPDDGSAGKVYMNGYRGVCDSNSGDKTKLNDSTQTAWATYFGTVYNGIAEIISGPGSQENMTYRRIIGSASGALDFTGDAWNIAHTTDSEYVILKTNTWTELTTTGLTAPVTDVCVANDIVYFAQGDAAPVRRYICYNAAGTFTEAWSNAGPYATFMKMVNDKTLGPVIYMARRAAVLNAGFGSTIYKDVAPKGYSSTRGLSSTVIEDCADAWNEETYANATSTYLGGGVVQTVVADGFTTGVCAAEAVTSCDVRPFNKVDMLITSSIDLAAADLQFLMDDTAKCASATFTLDFPALIAGDETRVTLTMAPAGVAGASAIISVGLKMAVDKGAVTLKIRGPITLLNTYTAIELQDRITGLEAYGDPEVLWVLAEGGLGYVENDQYNSVPIKEIANVASYRNGLAHCVGDVFLYFSLQDGVERYYRQNLDDIGPNLDDGMPSRRRGNVSAMVSYPGKVYAAIDGVKIGISSVLCYKGSGWHEIYRTFPNEYSSVTIPIATFSYPSIRSLYVQDMPQGNIQRLWIGEGSDMLFVPICLNPEHETEYTYALDGYLISSWIYAGMKDVVKYWKALKLFVENTVVTTEAIVADYQLDDDTTWTAITGDFDTPPLEENQLSSATPPAVTGRRIRFRIRIYSSSHDYAARVVASVVEGVGFASPKYAYTMNVLIGESELNIDLVGDDDTTFTNMAAAVAKLDDWAASHTLLTFRSVYGAFDNKTVYIDPVSLVPTEFIADNSSGDGREKHMFQITINEA